MLLNILVTLYNGSWPIMLPLPSGSSSSPPLPSSTCLEHTELHVLWKPLLWVISLIWFPQPSTMFSLDSLLSTWCCYSTSNMSHVWLILSLQTLIPSSPLLLFSLFPPSRYLHNFVPSYSVICFNLSKILGHQNTIGI